MRISGSGVASSGMRAIKERKELHLAKMAISCLHDALLAVARKEITADQVKEFFWNSDLERARPYGDVLEFSKDEKKGNGE